MIAFRAKNKVGYTSNQHLKIILNTIPMIPSELLPLSGTYTRDNTLSFSGKFAKASYSEDKLENTELTSAKLIYKDGKEVDVTDKVKVKINGGDYDKHLDFEYSPEDPLPDDSKKGEKNEE